MGCSSWFSDLRSAIDHPTRISFSTSKLRLAGRIQRRASSPAIAADSPAAPKGSAIPNRQARQAIGQTDRQPQPAEDRRRKHVKDQK